MRNEVQVKIRWRIDRGSVPKRVDVLTIQILIYSTREMIGTCNDHGDTTKALKQTKEHQQRGTIREKYLWSAPTMNSMKKMSRCVPLFRTADCWNVSSFA